jgi:hypothetical protein
MPLLETRRVSSALHQTSAGVHQHDHAEGQQSYIEY